MAVTQQLPVSAGSGTQTTTQSPQNSTQSATLSNQVDNVQIGTPASLLNNVGGISLSSTTQPTVNLASNASTTQPVAQQAIHHSPNLILVGFSGLLFVVAVVLFWVTSPSSKKYNKIIKNLLAGRQA